MSAVPAIRRTPGTRPQLRVVKGSRRSPWSAVASKACVFMCIAGLVFTVSSLCGQVMVEKARREGIRSMARAKDARRAEAILRRRIDTLTSLAATEDWAQAQGFVAPDRQVQPYQEKEVVALNH